MSPGLTHGPARTGPSAADGRDEGDGATAAFPGVVGSGCGNGTGRQVDRHDQVAGFRAGAAVGVRGVAPAGTVLLARSVLAERIRRAQPVGLGTAALAVSLLALA